MALKIEPKTDNKNVGAMQILGVVVIVTVVIIVACTPLGDALRFERLAQHETRLRAYQAERPVLVFGAAFLAYGLATGLSLPGAAMLTLAYGWYFGLARGLVLVSFASSAGATIAFLLSRLFFRDAIQKRFGDRLQRFNQSLEKDGPFFLFTLRLIPAVPFFIINAVMGLTPIRTRTFWWVSQLGMLPGTAVYVYAGSTVPELQTLADKGIGAAFTPSQLWQLGSAFVLLGGLPLVVRWGVTFFSRTNADPVQ